MFVQRLPARPRISSNTQEFEMANEVINEKRREFLGTSALVLSGAFVGVLTVTAPNPASAQSTAVKQPAVI